MYFKGVGGEGNPCWGLWQPTPPLCPQFSQALAIRSYTKFVMGVSESAAPKLHPTSAPGGGWEVAGARAGVTPVSLGCRSL